MKTVFNVVHADTGEKIHIIDERFQQKEEILRIQTLANKNELLCHVCLQPVKVSRIKIIDSASWVFLCDSKKCQNSDEFEKSELDWINQKHFEIDE